MAMKTRSMRRLTGLEVLDLPSQDDPLSQSWSVARSRSQAELEELMPGLQALVSRGDQGVFRTPTAEAHARSMIDMFERVVSFQHVAPPRLQLRRSTRLRRALRHEYRSRPDCCLCGASTSQWQDSTRV